MHLMKLITTLLELVTTQRRDSSKGANDNSSPPNDALILGIVDPRPKTNPSADHLQFLCVLD